jgi:hypothetical protein
VQRERRGKRDLPREPGKDLVWREPGGFLRINRGEGPRKLRVAVVLAGCGGGEGLLRGGELRGEPGAVAAAVAPGDEQDRNEHGGEQDLRRTQ